MLFVRMYLRHWLLIVREYDVCKPATCSLFNLDFVQPSLQGSMRTIFQGEWGQKE